MSGCLRIVVPIMLLLALGLYSALPHPTYSCPHLQAIAAESRLLMATHPIPPSGNPVDLPRQKWPPALADLKPHSVIVRHGAVDITTKPFFDGGWGYGFVPDKRRLPMLTKCWSALGHDVYWHGPC